MKRLSNVRGGFFYILSMTILIGLANAQQNRNSPYQPQPYPRITYSLFSSHSERARNSNTGVDIFIKGENKFLYDLESESFKSRSDVGLPFMHRYIIDIKISPDFEFDQTLFAVVKGSGIYKSENAGDSWISANSGLPNLDVCDISISPNFANDQLIMALTTTRDPNDYGYLMVTQDGGQSWQHRAQFQGLRDAIIAISPNAVSDSTVFIFEYDYIKFSTDMGKSWPFNPQSSVEGGRINSIAFSPNYANDNTMFVVTGSTTAGGGLYESNDKGLTWRRITRKLITNFWTDESLEALAVSPNFSSDNTLFAALVDGFVGTVGFWRTKDNGATMDSLYLDSWGGGTSGITNRGVSSMIISPNFINDKTLFLGTAIGVSVSSDEAESWMSINAGLDNLIIETLEISPNFASDKTLFTGTHRGIFRSTNGGLSWSSASTGLVESSLANVSDNPYAIDTLPSVAADKNGNAHIIWMGTHASSESPDGVATDVMYRKKTAGMFEEPTMITVDDDNYYSKFLSIAVDSDGYVHIVFLRMQDQLGAQGHVYYVNNRSGTFDNPILLVGKNDNAVTGIGYYSPTIAVDQEGIVHIVYHSSRDLYYMNDSSGTFGTPVSIANEDVEEPDITIDANGNVHIAYIEASSPSAVKYIHGKNGKFSTPIFVAPDATVLTKVSLAVAPNDTVHIVYRSGSIIHYVSGKDSTFGSTIPIAWGDVPSIAVDALGTAHMIFSVTSNPVYATNRNGSFELYDVSTPIGSFGGTRSSARGLAIGPDNILHTVFQAFANSIFSDLDHDIYYAEFAANTSASHIAFGSLKNPDGSRPKVEDITFQAWITSRPEEILTENSLGSRYQDGTWVVQCANFTSSWQLGDTLEVHLTNTTNAMVGTVSGVLTSAREDGFGETVLGFPTQVQNPRESQIPTIYTLTQNYPNPFNPETTIRYQLPKTSEVTIKIYNIAGQLVKTLVEEEQLAGYYSVRWNGKDDSGRDIASGVYFYRMETDNFVKVRKALFLK